LGSTTTKHLTLNWCQCLNIYVHHLIDNKKHQLDWDTKGGGRSYISLFFDYISGFLFLILTHTCISKFLDFKLIGQVGFELCDFFNGYDFIFFQFIRPRVDPLNCLFGNNTLWTFHNTLRPNRHRSLPWWNISRYDQWNNWAGRVYCGFHKDWHYGPPCDI
jgi:hypothetical protein